MSRPNHRRQHPVALMLACLGMSFFWPCCNASAQSEQESNAPEVTTLEDDIQQTPLRIREVSGEVIVDPVSVVPAVPENVAPAFISLLRFDGEVIDNRAELSAEVHVSLTRDDVWEEVALRLPEAQVMGVEYAGDGLHAPVLISDRADGLSWKFQGHGIHRLYLELEIPVVRAADGKSITLTLPKLHRMFASELRLRVPETPLDVRVEGGSLVQAAPENESTTVEVKIPGVNEVTNRSKLRLAWAKPVDVTPGTVASSDTRMTLQVIPTQRRLRLAAEQRIVPLDQNLQSLRVSVPSGFDAETDLLEVGGPQFLLHRTSTDANGRQFVIVTLERSSTAIAETELTWVYERSLDDSESQVLLDGFTVANARRQTGSLTVLPAEQYRLSVDWDELSGSRRTISELEASIATVAINNHPYSIPVRVRQERPYVTVAPETELVLSSTEATLRTEFIVSVDRSVVDELTIDWASESSSKWQNLRVISPDDATLVDDQGRTVIALKRPRNGPFSVVVAAEKPLAGETTSQLALPRMLAETERETALRVFTTDAVDAQIRALGESHLLDATLPEANFDAPDSNGLTLIASKSVAGEPAIIEVERVIRQSVVDASTTVTVEPQKQSVGKPILLAYSQQIDVAVKFGRRSELLLMLPEVLRAGLSTAALAKDLRISVDGESVADEALTEAGAGVIRLDLGSPRRTVQIQIEAIPITVPTDANVAQIPVIRLLDADFSSVRCRVPRNEVVTLAPVANKSPSDNDDPNAVPLNWVASPISSPAWSTWMLPETDSAIDGFGLSLSTSIDKANAVFGVRTAEIRVSQELESIAVRADFDVYEVINGVVIGIPRNASSVRFTWNGSVVRDIESIDELPNQKPPTASTNSLPQTVSPEGFRSIGIPTGDSATSGTVSVSYRLPTDDPTTVSQDFVSLPILPTAGVWLDQPVKIDLVISSDRHLLYSPAGLAKLFRWTRTGFVWSRVSTEQLLFPDESVTDAKRRYLFSSQTLPESILVTTSQGSFLILVGATATFVIAFLLYQYESLRRLPTLLTFGAAVALIGVINAELLQVLLQPAALGVGLAVLAVAIDRVRSEPNSLAPVVTVVADSQLSQLSAEMQPDTLPSGRSTPSETVLGSVSHSVIDP